MKHPLVSLSSAPTLSRFGFKYRERKIGVYLWLWYPLRHSGDGKHCWRTEFRLLPRRLCMVYRETWLTLPAGGRRTRGAPSQVDVADLDLRFDDFGHPEKMLLDLDDKPDQPLDIDAEVFYEKLDTFIAGCLKARHFEPFADWLCEEFPALAFLFLEPGKVNVL